MSWTMERIGELEKLWAEGLSTAEIGRRLGVTKNAVVGKAHRLRLPGRQSPIDPARRQAKKAAAPAKARAPRAKPASPVADAQPAAKPEPRRAQTTTAKTAPPPPPRRKQKSEHKGPACQWPFGDPRLPGFHFCGAPSEPGKPYCDEHCARAYNRVSSSQANARAENAAA